MATPEIGEIRNYSDIFFRNCAIAFMGQFRNQLVWTNNFSDTNLEVVVPIFYSLTGDPRFLYDAFVDDPMQCRISLDVPKVPSLIVTETNVTYNVNEQTNPNVKVQLISEKEDSPELIREYSTLKSIPTTITYKLDYWVSTEIDLWKFREAFLEIFYRYRFFTFEYNYLKIEAVFLMPEDFPNPINREFDFTKNNRMIVSTMEVRVQTYFPLFDKKRRDNRHFTKTTDTVWGQFKDNSVGATGDTRTLGNKEEYSSWETSNTLVADKRVRNWLYSIIEGYSDDIVAEGAVPDLSPEEYTIKRNILGGDSNIPEYTIDESEENIDDENII